MQYRRRHQALGSSEEISQFSRALQTEDSLGNLAYNLLFFLAKVEDLGFLNAARLMTGDATRLCAGLVPGRDNSGSSDGAGRLRFR